MSKRIHIDFFTTGYCTAKNSHVHKGEKPFITKFEALCALIDHPSLGKILFDTGYSNRFFDVTKKYPYRLYALATPVFHFEKQSCVNQLQQLGVKTEDIAHVVVSHFHADHICGLSDFHKNNFWCSEIGLNHFKSKNALAGVSAGYLKPLLPDKFCAQHPEKELRKITLGKFNAWQWKEDILFVDLPGHCRGQIGLFLRNTNLGDVFLVADAAWSSRAFKERIYPSRIVSFFVDNYKTLTQTIDNLHSFHTDNLDVKIIPTHCNEVAKTLIAGYE